MRKNNLYTAHWAQSFLEVSLLVSCQRVVAKVDGEILY